MWRVCFIQFCCNTPSNNIFHLWGDGGFLLPPILNKICHYLRHNLNIFGAMMSAKMHPYVCLIVTVFAYPSSCCACQHLKSKQYLCHPSCDDEASMHTKSFAITNLDWRWPTRWVVRPSFKWLRPFNWSTINNAMYITFFALFLQACWRHKPLNELGVVYPNLNKQHPSLHPYLFCELYIGAPFFLYM
jgi:hypothetical protein